MLGETGDWTGALTRITTMVNGGQDPVEGLPQGLCSGGLVEAYARNIEAEYGVELGMALPVILGGLSGATQGGFVVPMVEKVGKTSEQYTWSPVVMQFIGIAEAGQSKSTVLKEISGPLRFALDRKGLEHRRALMSHAREAAIKAHDAALVGNGDYDKTVVGKMYSLALCPSSVTDSGTQEGIKKALASNGGHRMILTAEPDVLGEISQYQGKGKTGSVGLMLRGWGQEDLDSDRVSDPQTAREPSLPFIILMQPESFTEYTGGGQERDRFVDRGVFSRTLLCRAERTPVVDKFEDWMSVLDGEDTPVDTAMGSPILAQREAMQRVMDSLVERTNAYRVSKGAEAAWKQLVAHYDWLLMPEAVKREKLLLYPKGDQVARLAALKVHVRLQQLRTQIRGAIAGAEAANPGIATLLDPLALRYTDHVMRIAALMTLADDEYATVIDTGYMEDVATRIMPWLWAQWWKVMQSRMEESAKTLVETGVLRNSRDLDTTGGERILKALIAFEDKAVGLSSAEGFVQSRIIDRATRRLPSGEATKAHFKKLLVKLVAEGLVEVVGESTNAAGTATSARYRITAAGRAELAPTQ